MGLAASAQNWSAPTIGQDAYASEFKTSVLADSLQGDSTFYYLYNIGAKAFLTEGNAPSHSQWGTNATLNELSGHLIMVSKYELVETPDEANVQNVGASEPAEWDGKSYILHNLRSNGWYSIILTSANGCFVDRAKQIDYKWELLPQGNGVYRIKTADVNPNFNNEGLGLTESYFGWDALDPDYTGSEIKAITPAIDMSDPDVEPYVDWAFVSEATYNLYVARLALYNTLNAAVESGVDYAAAAAVYENASATIEQINEAKDALQKAINDKAFGEASEDNPQDVTDWLVNADFSAGSATGWHVGFVGGTNATNVGYQGASYTNGDVKINQFIEAWAANGTSFNPNLEFSAIGVGELTQTIENMPAGLYKFTVDCIAVQQWEAAENPVKGVQLFATGGNLDIYKTIATGNEKPEHFEIIFVNDGSTIKLGLRTTEECTANWIAADNFTLTYYGPTTKDPYQVALDAAIAEQLNAHPLEELDDVKAYVGDKDGFKAAIEEAQAATADFASYVDKVENAGKTLTNSIAAYAAYIKQVDYIRDYLAEHDLNAAEAEYLADYVMEDNVIEPDDDFVNGSADYILENCLLTVEQINAEAESITALLQTAIANSLHEGDDCTDMITNASFEEGFTGWTHKGGNVGDFRGLEPAIPNNVEVYEGVVDCYQVVEGVPDGIYSLSLRGFERPAGNGSYTGEEAPKVFLYMNDFQTPVQNIVTGALPADDANDGENCYLSRLYEKEAPFTWDMTDYDVAGHGWVPNGMVGAAIAFRAGRYEQKVYGLVDGGTMKIGVTSNGVTAHWVLWADFQLTYEGKSVEALTNVLPIFIEPVETYLNENVLTDPAVDAARTLISNAKDAIQDKDTEAMYACLLALYNITADLKANSAAVEALLAAVNEMDAASDVTTNGAALDAYEAIQTKVAEYESLTTEEVIALTDEVKAVTTALKTPADMDSASDENPVELTTVIVNPSYENSDCNGWEGSVRDLSGLNRTDMVEFYQATFDHHQTICGLQAGTYELQLNCFNRVPSTDAQADLKSLEAGDKAKVQTAFVYATVGDKTYAEPFRMISEGARTSNELISASCSTIKDSEENTLYTPNNMQTAGACFEETDENGAALSDEQNYLVRVVFTLDATSDVTIGAKNTSNGTWAIWDNWKLFYFGTSSAKADSGDATGIEAAEVAGSKAAVAGIYTISGAQVSTLQKGINIVRYADGKTEKVLVK